MENLVQNYDVCKSAFYNAGVKDCINTIHAIMSKKTSIDVEFIYYLDKLRRCLKDAKFSKSDSCMLFSVKDGMSYYFYELYEKAFGLSSSTTEKLLRVANKFIECRADVGGNLKPKFIYGFLYDLSISKIIELLPLSMASILSAFDNGYLTKYSTVKQIREYIKSLKTKKEDNTVIEAVEQEPVSDESDVVDEPLYDVTKQYELEFFESLTKEQLIPIVMTMQNEIHKKKK